MESLLRTRVGMFTLSNSLRLSEIEEKMKLGMLEESLLKTDCVFPEYEQVHVEEKADRFLYNGNLFFKDVASYVPEKQEYVRVYDSKNQFIGLYEYDTDRQCFKPYKMFLET